MIIFCVFFQLKDDAATPDAYLTSVFYKGYWGASQVRQIQSDLVPLENGFCSFRAHGLINITLLTLVQDCFEGSRQPVNLVRPHTQSPSNTRDRRITHSLQGCGIRRIFRPHSCM